MAKCFPSKNFEVTGVGNLAHTTVANLFKECPKEFNVGIEIRNHHPKFELVYHSDYFVSGVCCAAQVPLSISPYKKDAMVLHASREDGACNGLLMFSMNPVVYDFKTKTIERQSTRNAKQLLIGWKMSSQRKKHVNEFAFGIERISELQQETFEDLMNRPVQEWFQRNQSTEGEIILENNDVSMCYTKIVASMEDKKKANIILDFCYF